MGKINMDNLEHQVDGYTKKLIAFIIMVCFVYLVWFMLINGQVISDNTGTWGQFGDFLGGILNPIIALSAFYWLTKSILIQKEELSETRGALRDSQRAQERQAELALLSAELQAYGMRLSVARERQVAEIELRNIVIQKGFSGSSYVNVLDTNGNPVHPLKLLEELGPSIDELEDIKEEALIKIDELLAKIRIQQVDCV